MGRVHRRRIRTEEKAKVVAAVWGTECIQFLAALAILHQDNFEEQDEFLQIILVQNIPFFKSPYCKIASAASDFINSFPQTEATNFAFFLSLSFFYGRVPATHAGHKPVE